MFKRKDKSKEINPEYAVIIQNEIFEILEIVEDQQTQIDRLIEQFRQLQEICEKKSEA